MRNLATAQIAIQVITAGVVVAGMVVALIAFRSGTTEIRDS
jgi:hypothetical protein